MSNENGHSEGGVALLVDFENLALDAHGAARDVDCGALMALAARYGPVRGANAYADWRTRTMRRYPEDFYGLGMEFVPVLGRYRGRVLKNAVDVRMAVDAMEVVHTMPFVDVYVLATGDRDLVQVVQALQRHGKTVVGVAPQDAASAELAGLCDRFVYYESIAWRGDPRPEAANGRGTLRALLRNGRAAERVVRGVLGFRGVLRGGPEQNGGAGSPGGSDGIDLGDGRSADAGVPRGLGWGWFEWVRDQLGSGAVEANAAGGWLHRVGDDAFAVEPDCFAEWAAREGVAGKTARNRVARLGRHRVHTRSGRRADRFRALLGDGRRVRGMLFPGELLWGDDAPEDGTAALV
ncbi:MAG: NYN domain-containing protein [Gammaproteobacteria bacterium]|nr:NYN domain-containing protein [Gammaproteobacteria bacterium]